MSARRHHTVVAGQRHLVRVFPVVPVSPSVGGREKGTSRYFFSLPVTIKAGKSPLCREFLEYNKAATPITLLTAVTVAPRYSINRKTTKPFYRF